MTTPEGLNTHDIRILIAEDDDDDLFLFKELIFEWADWDYYTRRNTKVTVTVDSAPTQVDILKRATSSGEALFSDMQVDRGGVQAPVPEQLLHDGDLHSRFQ